MSDNRIVNIAIDGPAGAGKSTIAKRLAGELGFIYVDTGAMYRAMALDVIRRGIDASDEKSVSEAAGKCDVTSHFYEGEQHILLNGEDVNRHIRTEEVGNTASTISKYKAVRQALLKLQQDLAANNNVIMDGRDIGTTILPNAFLKIFLTADVSVRAKRRYNELLSRGEKDIDIAVIEKDIRERDEQDATREVSPLRQADDAVLLDSSHLSVDEVVQKIKRLYKERLA